MSGKDRSTDPRQAARAAMRNSMSVVSRDQVQGYEGARARNAARTPSHPPTA